MANIQFTRRNFIKTAALSSATALLPVKKLFPFFNYEAKIGLQLYSVGKQIEADFKGTMHKVANTGFAGIESYALPENLTVELAAKVLKETGLKVFSMHSEIPDGKLYDETLKNAELYGCDTVVYHGWPQVEKYKNTEALKHMVEVNNKISEVFEFKGMHFGLHNHW